MADETAPEAESVAAQKEVAPWWVNDDGLVGVGYRLDVLARVGLPVEMTLPEYERALDRLAFWCATGEWPAPPEPPGKPRHLRPV